MASDQPTEPDGEDGSGEAGLRDEAGQREEAGQTGEGGGTADAAGAGPVGGHGTGGDGPMLPGDAPTDYERYLKVPELLSLQKPTDEMNHHDELLFQTVHQTAELWFKEALFELGAAGERMDDGDVLLAARLLRRAARVLRVLTEQIHLLETMNPWDFHAIRRGLGHGSGSESPGFRRILERAPRAWPHFEDLLDRRDVALKEVYTDADVHEDLLQLAEALTDFDEAFQLWRQDHLSLVKRVIGRDVKSLKGYTVHQLEDDVQHVLFPALWKVRNELTEEAGTSPG